MINWCQFVIESGKKPKIRKLWAGFVCDFDLPTTDHFGDVVDVLIIQGYGNTHTEAYEDWVYQQYCHLSEKRKPPTSTVDYVRKEGNIKKTSILREIKIAAGFGFLAIAVFYVSEWLFQ